MRVRHKKPGLPKTWGRYPGVVAEADITPTRHGRLAAKLIVFTTPKTLQEFWRDVVGNHVGRDCRGVVNSLQQSVCSIDRHGNETNRRMQVDPRYFCVIGLCVGWLSSEVIAHESMHAGFAYARRAKRDPWAKSLDCDEEAVCYPAGIICRAINDFCHNRKLFDLK